MTDGFRPEGLDGVSARAAEAAAALEALREPAERAAASIEEAFDRAGDSLARSLTRAVLGAVNAAAGVRGGGLSAAIAQAVGGLFGGTRAEGGPVLGGGAYLVGERGPEVFRPSGAGVIEPATGPGVTVNVRIDGGAPGVMRSEAQIAQSLARAVALGARRM